MSSSSATSLDLSQSALVSAPDRKLAARVSDSDSDSEDLTGDSDSDNDNRTADEGTIYNNKDLGFIYRRLRREMRAEAASANQDEDDDGQLTGFGEFADSAPSPVPETPAAYLLEEEDSELPDVSASGKRSIDIVKSEEDELEDTSHDHSDEHDSKRRRVDSKEDDEEYQDWLFYQYARRQAAKREAGRRRLRAPHAVMRTMQLPPRCPLPHNIHITTKQQPEEDDEDSKDSVSDGDAEGEDTKQPTQPLVTRASSQVLPPLEQASRAVQPFKNHIWRKSQ